MSRELPDVLPSDPNDRLAVLGAAIADRVEAAIPEYVVASVTRIIDTWGRCSDATRQDTLALATERAPTLASAIGADLRAELGAAAELQRRTPLQIVATVVEVPTALLEACGIPAVVRDPTDEARHADDLYDLTPRALADLGDPELGPLQLAWGLAKHEALRAKDR